MDCECVQNCIDSVAYENLAQMYESFRKLSLGTKKIKQENQFLLNYMIYLTTNSTISWSDTSIYALCTLSLGFIRRIHEVLTLLASEDDYWSMESCSTLPVGTATKGVIQ